ncbi:MAG: isocitrate lyase/PEP mutase family protein [Pseudomonadota bacterium]
MEKLKTLIAGKDLVVAPVVLNPLMARLAQDTGFAAGYVSGGSLGWLQCATEANLSLHEMAQLALDIRAASPLPLVLDAGGGWGDPVHMHRTMALSEAAGYQALEVEDQYLPRRVHHHIGVERLVEPALMVQKIRELRAARTNSDTLIIARTNALRLTGMDDALRRAELFHKAGADMLFVHTRDPEEIRTIGERLPSPLMIFAPGDGFGNFGLSKQDMADLGFRLAASSGSAFAAMYKAIRQSYECLMRGEADPFLADGGPGAQLKRAHATCGLPGLLEIERNTTGDT